MMKVRLHKKFEKRYVKLPHEIRAHFKERRDIFILDSFHPLLQNHALKGKYQGYRSINITGDYRAVYKLENDNLALFVDIGTHSELYS